MDGIGGIGIILLIIIAGGAGAPVITPQKGGAWLDQAAWHMTAHL